MAGRITLLFVCVLVGAAVLSPGTARATGVATLQQTVPTLTAADLYGKTPEAFQYRVLRSMRRIAVLDAPMQRARFGIGYNDFEFGTYDGEAWTFDVAYERTQSPWGWGLLSPSQLWDISGLDDLLQIGLAPYVFTYVSDTVRVSGFVEVDLTNSDIAGIGDETSYAVGGTVSATLTVSEMLTIAPVGIFEQYWAGQDGQDDSTIFQVGSDVAIDLGEQFDIAIYGYYTFDSQNDDIDDSFFEYGASLTFMIAESWGVTVGYEGTSGAEEFEADRVYVDAQYDF
jgi:hypothetical protein